MIAALWRSSTNGRDTSPGAAESRRVLTDLLEEAFTIRHCSGVATVWKDLLAGETGVVIADFTGLTSLAAPDRCRVSALSHVIPVLLLVDDPATAHLARTEAGNCSVLFEPFNDLDRLLSPAVELRQFSPTLGSVVLSAF